MKKKILSLLTCLALIMVCLFVATGCGETPDTNIYVSNAQELTTAVANAKDDAVIVLKNDIDVTAQLNVDDDIVIDLNGHKIYNTTDIWNDTDGIDTWSIFSVKEGGDLTITGNGEIDAKENDCFVVDLRGGDCTIKNSKLTGNITVVYVVDGNLVVEGGEFNIKQLSEYDDHRYELNFQDANKSNEGTSIKVKGGKFYKFNPAVSNSESPEMNFLAEGYQSVADWDFFVVSKIAD